MSFGGFRFRLRRAYADGRLHPLVIVAVCLVAAVLLTLIVGNLLNIWMNDDLYQRLTGETGMEPPAAEEEPTVVRRVNAYLYTPGESVDSIGGKTAISVPINRADGSFCYTSDLLEHLSLPVNAEVPLDEAMAEAYGMVPYISGVFYSSAFTYESADLRYAAAMQEAAILREFLRAGGSEIVIRGLPLDQLTQAEIDEYISILKTATDNFYIGIAMPWEMVKADAGWRIPAVFAKAADFGVLDLSGISLEENDSNDAGLSRSAEELLADCAYYTSQYKLRILASDQQVGLISTMEVSRVTNFQIAPHEMVEVPPEEPLPPTDDN